MNQRQIIPAATFFCMGKKNFDSEFCGRLPLNNVNLIQDYGYLLIASNSNLRILQISENSEKLFRHAPEELIKKDLDALLASADIELLKTHISGGQSGRIPFELTISENRHSALLHLKPEYLVLEIESLP